MRSDACRFAVVVTLAAAVASSAAAHDFDCDFSVGVVLPGADGPALGPDGLPSFSSAPAPIAAVAAYPALVGFEIELTNVAADPSTIGAASSPFLDALAGTQAFGAAFAPGTAIGIGETARRIVVVPVPSHEACVALGGEPDLACRPAGTLEARFVVAHEAGSTECRTRLVCEPPQPPPACRAPEWTGARVITPEIQVGNAVAVGCDGAVHVAGNVLDPTTFVNAATLTTLDATGDVSRVLEWGTDSSFPTATSVSVSTAGRFVVSGTYGDPPVGFTRAIDAGGAVVWEVLFEDLVVGDACRRERCIASDVDANGNVYVAYAAPVASRGDDVKVTKLAPDGVEVWTRVLGTEQTDAPLSAAIMPGGDVVVSGATLGAFPGFTNGGGTADGAWDAFVLRLDANGTTRWVRQLGTDAEDFARSVAVGPAGQVGVAGTTFGALVAGLVPGEYGDAFVAMLEGEDGAVRWIQQLGATATPDPFRGSGGEGAAVDAEGALWSAGRVYPGFPGAVTYGLGDAFIARHDAVGTLLWVTQFWGPNSDAMEDVRTDSAGHGVATGRVGLHQFQSGATLVVRVRPDGTY